MKLKSIREVKIKGKRVLLRSGFDVPFDKRGKIRDDERIRDSLPTIKYLLKKKAKIIIISHNGRPNGRRVKRLAMDEVAKRLAELLRKKVDKLNECLGEKVKEYVARMKSGQIVVLENLRFCQEEKRNDLKFAKSLASLADIYINDAFANSHRQHASMVGIPRYLPSYAGFLLEKEINFLEKFIKQKKRPFVAVVGGAKISTKLGAVLNLRRKVDVMLLGGALANTILKSMNIQIGSSLIENNMIKKIKKLDLTDIGLKIPVDVIVAKGNKVFERPVGRVGRREKIYDIGPDTIALYKAIIEKAKRIVWAGPMGYFEKKKFSRGSYEIAKAIAESRGVSLVGGGDTVEVLNELGLKNKIDFVSTGGGAMLKFLENETLPALKPLIKK